MDSSKINIKNLMNIPEKEFKQHFRDWMEQDDVARSLQAKLRRDLIVNFNKTSLGKQIIAQTGVTHRLSLSPLLLALNTVAAEFLYAQNCHFTLSVFCTEVPYRNTLPDFESSHCFRFSEHEIFEILDALASAGSNFDMDTKQSITKEYSKKDNPSLLFVVIKNLLSKPKNPIERQEHHGASGQLNSPGKNTSPISHKKIPENSKTTDKLNSKVEYQSKNFRYLNKYLLILSKKMKEMSVNMDALQKGSQTSQTVKKSLQMRKMENLNRNLEKISENLRHLSVAKRKNKRLSAVVTAVNTMAKQFERCLLNFDHLSRNMSKGGVDGVVGGQKAYSDWIHEMRTTDNGKLFLDKIESALRKALNRERKKMETELAERSRIQKEILKFKYKKKLAEELSTMTEPRLMTMDFQQAKSNEVFEKKLNEFEVKHKELHSKIQEAEKRLMTAKTEGQDIVKNKVTQTEGNRETKAKEVKILVNEPKNLHEMVRDISEQERQVDHIVFDAKLRVQELEHESNQLDRTFRDYLERQRSDKQQIRENAASIWQSYALGKSILNHTKATSVPIHRLNAIYQTNKRTVIIPDMKTTETDLNIPTISIDDAPSASIDPPPAVVFENPFLVAKRKVLSRNKMTIENKKPSPPSIPDLPLPLTIDTDSSDEEQNNWSEFKQNKQPPRVTRLIQHTNDGKSDTKEPQPSLPNRATDVTFRKLNRTTTITTTTRTSTNPQLLSPEFDMDEISLDGIELSPTTAKSSSARSRSGDSTASSNGARGGIFKLKRQLFASNKGTEYSLSASPSPSLTSSVQQMNGNDDNKKPLLGINKHPIVVDDLKKFTEAREHNKEIMEKNLDENSSENKASEVVLGAVAGVELNEGQLKAPGDDDVGAAEQGLQLDISISIPEDKKDSSVQ